MTDILFRFSTDYNPALVFPRGGADGSGLAHDTAPIANGPERGVHAASSFGSPPANRFVDAHSDTEAA